jgi:murein endopeptidase
VDAQSRVLESLQQAMQATMQNLQQQANQNPGQGQGRAPGARAQERDPFGRSMGDEAQGANTGYVAIPDKSDLQQSREIRDELRRRSGEPARPRSERDYIKRLLKEF